MPKLSDLHLSDQPLDDRPTRSEAAEDFLEEIRILRDQDRYQFAEDTLRGIKESVERSGTVTAKQRQAVRNIAESQNRGREKGGWSRRYEGR